MSDSLSRRQFLIGLFAVGAATCLPMKAAANPVAVAALGTAVDPLVGYGVPCSPSLLSTIRWKMNEWAASCNTSIQSWAQSIIGHETIDLIKNTFSWDETGK